MPYRNRSISIDDNVYEQARKILKEELNMTMSKYIEIQLRTLVSSQSQTVKEVYGGLVTELVGDMLKSKGKDKKK